MLLKMITISTAMMMTYMASSFVSCQAASIRTAIPFLFLLLRGIHSFSSVYKAGCDRQCHSAVLQEETYRFHEKRVTPAEGITL